MSVFNLSQACLFCLHPENHRQKPRRWGAELYTTRELYAIHFITKAL